MDITSTRNALIDHITSVLESHQFQRTDDTFEVLRYMVRPGRRMIINGQVFDEEPTKIPLTLRVELHGTGCIESPDGCVEHFELISFEIKDGEESHSETANVYYGCHREFNEYLQRYFNLR